MIKLRMFTIAQTFFNDILLKMNKKLLHSYKMTFKTILVTIIVVADAWATVATVSIRTLISAIVV